MTQNNYQFADLSASDVQKIKQVESDLSQTENTEVILLAYKKQ